MVFFGADPFCKENNLKTNQTNSNGIHLKTQEMTKVVTPSHSTNRSSSLPWQLHALAA
jgi:hypothetical protein